MKPINKFLFLLFALVLLFNVSACGSTQSSSSAPADLNAVYTDLTQSADLPEMMDISAEEAQNYYGISADDCNQMVMKISDDGLRVDEIWLIEAKDSDTADALTKLATSRMDQIEAETQNYLPDQYKVASGAKVVEAGNYVALFLTPDADAMSISFQKMIG